MKFMHNKRQVNIVTQIFHISLLCSSWLISLPLPDEVLICLIIKSVRDLKLRIQNHWHILAESWSSSNWRGQTGYQIWSFKCGFYCRYGYTCLVIFSLRLLLPSGNQLVSCLIIYLLLCWFVGFLLCSGDERHFTGHGGGLQFDQALFLFERPQQC